MSNTTAKLIAFGYSDLASMTKIKDTPAENIEKLEENSTTVNNVEQENTVKTNNQIFKALNIPSSGGMKI